MADSAKTLQLLQDMGIDLWQTRPSASHAETSAQMQAVEPQTCATTPENLSPTELFDQGVEDVYPHQSPKPLSPTEPQAPNQSAVHSLDWDGLKAQVKNCEACALHRGRTKTVFGVGSEQANWLIIGEAPGRDEDKQGEPFVGRAGQLLNAMLLAVGLQREQIYIANTVKCRPPQNRDPDIEEMHACAPYLQRQIALIQPKLIILLGRIAAQRILNTESPIARLRGQVHRYQDIPTIVSYHPAYLLRRPVEKAKSWQDLQFALRTAQPL